MKNPIFEPDFWRIRLNEAKNIGLLSHAIGQGFNFGVIDEIHQEIIKNLIRPEDKVLDFGCGYGRTCQWFPNYVGVDFIPEFIEIARIKFPEKKFILADIRNLPFGDKNFDWAVGISMKEMIRRDAGEDEWKKVEDELKRIAKKILILEYGNSRPEDIKKYEVIQGNL